jgi:hypothetical protein
MDLRQFKAGETGTLQFKDGHGNSLPVSATFHAPGSRGFAQAQANQTNKTLEILRGGKKELSTEDKTRLQAEYLADLTVSWDGNERDGLQGWELSVATYSDSTIGFISEQAQRFLSSWANFTPSFTKE